MTNDELNDIVSAARARQPDITPAPWSYDADDEAIIRNRVYDFNDWLFFMGGDATPADAALVTDAPNLNAAVIAMADELEAARARIATLERKLGYLEAHTIYNDPFKA